MVGTQHYLFEIGSDGGIVVRKSKKN